ncbi:MAG: Lrp/AsnC family transcriptional regulator [Candidatus Woesearchaeota archaeon]
MDIKNEDMKIVSQLRKNSRESLTKISRSTNIPVSTIFDKLKNKTNSVIKKHTCIIDFPKIGMTTRVKMILKVLPDDREPVRDFLKKSCNLNSLYKINNGYDYFADMVFRSLKELEEFLEKLDDNYRIKTRMIFYVIEELECERYLSGSEIDCMQ